jgi:hypothetical protein
MQGSSLSPWEGWWVQATPRPGNGVRRRLALQAPVPCMGAHDVRDASARLVARHGCLLACKIATTYSFNAVSVNGEPLGGRWRKTQGCPGLW